MQHSVAQIISPTPVVLRFIHLSCDSPPNLDQITLYGTLINTAPRYKLTSHTLYFELKETR